MKKVIYCLVILSVTFLLFACTGNSFDDIKINADDVTDIAEGTYTLRYTIEDYDKYNSLFPLSLQVSAFDQDNKKIDVNNNRTIEVKADCEYTVTILLSATVDGEVKTKSKTFTVTAVKLPRKVTFYVGSKVFAEKTVKYGERIDLEDYKNIPDLYTTTGTGINQSIIDKKWVIYIDYAMVDLKQEHLENITTDLTIEAKYTYSITYSDITISFDNGDDATSTPSITQIAGSHLNMPDIPTRSGYVFDGWYTDKEYKNIFSWKYTNNVVTDTVLYAKWLIDDTEEFIDYFDYNLYTAEERYPYYKVVLKRDVDYPTDISVPVGYNNIPVRGFDFYRTGIYIYGAFENTDVMSVTIPEGFTYSNQSSFKNCQKLTSVIFKGNNLQDIGAMTFYGCTSLEEITIPEGVLFIGTAGFSGCTALKLVNLPSTFSSLSSELFDKCTSLEKIVIPDSVVRILDSFTDCTALKEVVIGQNSSLNYLSKGTFKGCSALTTITLPYSFKDVSSVKDAFDEGVVITFHLAPTEE